MPKRLTRESLKQDLDAKNNKKSKVEFTDILSTLTEEDLGAKNNKKSKDQFTNILSTLTEAETLFDTLETNQDGNSNAKMNSEKSSNSTVDCTINGNGEEVEWSYFNDANERKEEDISFDLSSDEDEDLFIPLKKVVESDNKKFIKPIRVKVMDIEKDTPTNKHRRMIMLADATTHCQAEMRNEKWLKRLNIGQALLIEGFYKIPGKNMIILYESCTITEVRANSFKSMPKDSVPSLQFLLSAAQAAVISTTTAAQLCKRNNKPNEVFSLRGRIVHVEDKIHRKLANGDEVPLINVVLKDKSGELVVAFWRNLAEADFKYKDYIQVSNLRIQMYRGNPVAQTTYDTKIEKIDWTDIEINCSVFKTTLLTPDARLIKLKALIDEVTMVYPSCPIEGCNFKKLNEEDGNWTCTKCNNQIQDPAQGAMIKLKGVPKEKLEGEDRKLTTYTVFANSIRKLLGAWPNQFDPKLTSGKLNGMVENKIPIVVRDK